MYIFFLKNDYLLIFLPINSINMFIYYIYLHENYYCYYLINLAKVNFEELNLRFIESRNTKI